MLRAPLLIVALALLWGSGFFWIKLALDGLGPVNGHLHHLTASVPPGPRGSNPPASAAD